MPSMKISSSGPNVHHDGLLRFIIRLRFVDPLIHLSGRDDVAGLGAQNELRSAIRASKQPSDLTMWFMGDRSMETLIMIHGATSRPHR
jgi:hypothetical protein